MEKSESLAAALTDGLKKAAFDKYREEELAKRKTHTKDQLLNSACTFAAYIRMLNTGLASDIDLLCQARLNGMKAQKTKQAKSAVGKREDQQLKPDWIEHCEKVKASGAEIRILADLLNVQGYKFEIAKITPITLKRWAGEAGIKFKSGRPKK